MIKGIGTDIVEIERIKKALEKQGFLERYFTETEILLYQERGYKAQTIAADFAAKEAAVKAMGTGFSGFSAIEMEVLRNEKGAPFLKVYGKCSELWKELGIKTIHLSLSHSKEYATAFALAEGGSKDEGCDSKRNGANG